MKLLEFLKLTEAGRRGPHQKKELALMLSGKKQLALVDLSLRDPEEQAAWGDAVRAGKIVHKRGPIASPTQDSDYFAVPGQEWRMNKMAKIFNSVRATNVMTDDDHTVLGKLLGYSDEDIDLFLNVSPGMNEAQNPKVRVKYMPRNDAYYAYLGKKRVGQAQLWEYSDDRVGENERYIWKSAVHDDYKRQGIATELYDVIAKELESKGLKLVPSPDQQLSQEAYEFWKARDPESIKKHGKYLAEPYQKYAGQPITAKGRPAVIWKAMASMSGGIYFAYRYTDVPEGSTNSVGTAPIDSLMDQLQISEGKISTTMRLIEFFNITESMNFYPSSEQIRPKIGKVWASVFPDEWTAELDHDKVDWERYHGDDYDYEPPTNPEYRPDLDLNLSNANMAYILGEVLGYERDEGFHIPIDHFLGKAQIWLQKNMGQTTPQLPSSEEPREFKRQATTDPETGLATISGGHQGPRMIHGGRREGYDEQTIMRMVQIASLGKERGATHVSAF